MFLSDSTSPGQSEPGCDGNEVALHIPKISSITETSPSDCFVSYAGPWLVGGASPLCRDAVGRFNNSQPTGPALLL